MPASANDVRSLAGRVMEVNTSGEEVRIRVPEVLVGLGVRIGRGRVARGVGALMTGEPSGSVVILTEPFCQRKRLRPEDSAALDGALASNAARRRKKLMGWMVLSVLTTKTPTETISKR